MKTYRITRNDETIGIVAAFSLLDAASAFAKRVKAGAFADHLADGTYQAMDYRPKLRRFDPVGQPFMVEGGR